MRKTALALTMTIALAASAIDTAGIDPAVHPGDDFYAYSNGGWMKATEIPADRSNYGVFASLSEEADRRTADLIRNAGKSKVGDYFASFMNQEAIESRGLDPVEPQLKQIESIRTKKALSSYLGSEVRADVDPLNNTNFHTDRIFGVFVSPSFSNPNRNAAYLLQGGLGMPDRAYYLGTDPGDVAIQEKYRQHIEATLTLMGYDDAAARAARIYELERKIAVTHASADESQDVHRANNPWTREQFTKKAPGLSWPAFFSAAGLEKASTIIVWHPSAAAGVATLVESEPLELWRDYLAFHAVDRMSAFLPKRFDDEQFKFYGTALAGVPKQRDRWKRAVSATNIALGHEVGKLYAARYFPPAAKEKAQAMVKNIVAAFGRRIENLQWMSPATRAKAKAKLATLYVGIGYPEHWRDYSGLAVKADDAFGNSKRASLFDYRAAIAKIGKPVDKTEWWLTPQTVNALNVPLQNALNFPAAILNPPFYDANADDVENYGAIGSVIGHEISHSFDDQGSLFDAQGKLANWWTREDFAHFAEEAGRLVRQYDEYEPLPGLHVNGKLTLSENIADAAGLSAAYDGYRAAYGNKEAPAANGLSGDQRFFVAYAQAWRTKRRAESLRNLVLTDGHAPGEFRADTVRNIDAWYTAFDVQPGRRLYLAPADRVRVW